MKKTRVWFEGIDDKRKVFAERNNADNSIRIGTLIRPNSEAPWSFFKGGNDVSGKCMVISFGNLVVVLIQIVSFVIFPLQ